MLLLPDKPPVPVRGKGRMTPKEAITTYLPGVFARTENPRHSLLEMQDRIDQVVCWTTWRSIVDTLASQLETIPIADASLRESMRRLVGAVANAIAWHR